MCASNIHIYSISVVFIILVQLTTTTAASFEVKNLSFVPFQDKEDHKFFKFAGVGDNFEPIIRGGALQLTPDTTNVLDRAIHYNKSGRIMYYKPFRLWSDDSVASFNTSFVINMFRNSDWDAGHGLAFLIAPNASIPEASYGQWLGLTNQTTDGNTQNQIVAIEFDTDKQDHDPNDNHIGLNINSVKSTFDVSLDDHNITLSPLNGSNYQVWVQYNIGGSKMMEIYMAREGQSKPQQPLINQTIDLKQYVKQDSYLGFAGSTGQPQIQLNCVRAWGLDIEVIPKPRNDRRLKFGVGVGVAVAGVMLVLFGLVYAKMRRGRQKRDQEKGGIDCGPLRLPGMPREYKYKDLKKATNNFHESMKLGEGGFGIVFKGVLHDKDHLHHQGDNNNDNNSSKEIAVKKFTRDNIKSKDDFMAELTIIHRLRHKHLVRLVGWCYEKGKLLLVYDFMPNGSLDMHLYQSSNKNTLSWRHRCKIVAGVASAVHYLHNEYDEKVVHRDLKPSNIFLDSDFNARLGDFGLARALEKERNSYAELLGGVPGTLGYVAPECFHTGKASPESDVFGFGAVVLETVSGRNPGVKIQHEQYFCTLVDWVWMLHRDGRIDEAVDVRLNNGFDVDEAKRLLLLGLACSHPIASERPKTQDILQILSGSLPPPYVPPFKPSFTWPSMGVAIGTSSLLSSITLSLQDFGGTQSGTHSQSASMPLPL